MRVANPRWRRQDLKVCAQLYPLLAPKQGSLVYMYTKNNLQGIRRTRNELPKGKKRNTPFRISMSYGLLRSSKISPSPQQISSTSISLPSLGPSSDLNVRPKSSNSIWKQTPETAGSYLPLLSSSLINASRTPHQLFSPQQTIHHTEYPRCAPAISYQLNSTPFSLNVFRIKSRPSGGTSLSFFPWIMTSSPLMSPQRWRLSSFLPSPRVWLWMSVAK